MPWLLYLLLVVCVWRGREEKREMNIWGVWVGVCRSQIGSDRHDMT